MENTRAEQAAREASEARESLLDTIAALVFACLPLSVQAITLPALSKAWKQWVQGAKERALQAAKNDEFKLSTGFSHASTLTYVPLWAAQSQYLSDEQKRRFRRARRRRRPRLVWQRQLA